MNYLQLIYFLIATTYALDYQTSFIFDTRRDISYRCGLVPTPSAESEK